MSLPQQKSSLKYSRGPGSTEQVILPSGTQGENCHLASSVRSVIPNLQGRISPRELRRRLWHISPGILPFVFQAIPHRDPLGWPALTGIFLVAVALISAAILRHRSLERRGEQDFLTAVLGHGCPALTLLLLLPAHTELGMAVLAISAFGDGTATLAGLLIRGPALPWNPQKTWAGSAAFVACALPMSFLAYSGEARPGVDLSTVLMCTAAATLAGAAAESLRFRMNDNIRVGLAAAVTLVLVQAAVVGM